MEEAKQKIIDGELTVKGYKDFANEEEYNAYIKRLLRKRQRLVYHTYGKSSRSRLFFLMTGGT